MPKINLKAALKRMAASPAYGKLWVSAPVLGGLVGAPIGAIRATGGMPSVPRPKTYPRRPDEPVEKYRKRVASYRRHAQTAHEEQRQAAAVSGALRGGIMGFLSGSLLRSMAPFPIGYGAGFGTGTAGWGRRTYGAGAGAGAARATKPLHATAKKFQSSVHGAKTKAEASSIFRDAARSTHPDKPGGTSEAFRDVKDVWDRFKRSGRFDKLAFLQSLYGSSFVNELEKVARLTPEEEWKIVDLKREMKQTVPQPLSSLLGTVGSTAGMMMGLRRMGPAGILPGILFGSMAAGAAKAGIAHLGQPGRKRRRIREQIKTIRKRGKQRDIEDARKSFAAAERAASS